VKLFFSYSNNVQKNNNQIGTLSFLLQAWSLINCICALQLYLLPTRNLLVPFAQYEPLPRSLMRFHDMGEK